MIKFSNYVHMMEKGFIIHVLKNLPEKYNVILGSLKII